MRGAIVGFGWCCSQRGNLHEVLSDWSLPSPCNDDLQVATAETWGSCRLDPHSRETSYVYYVLPSLLQARIFIMGVHIDLKRLLMGT